MASTFEQLAGLTNDRFEAILRAGTPPTAADLTGYEFRGWNQNPGTDIIGTRKFIRGFYGVMPDGTGWGYNMPVEQTGMNRGNRSSTMARISATRSSGSSAARR